MTAAWTTNFDATWLASSDACARFDEQLAKLISGHLRARWRLREELSPARVLPMQCATTSDAVRQLGPSPACSVHVTILLALMGELLLSAESGGILRKETCERFAGSDSELAIACEAVRLLRNAICHPASTADRGDDQGIPSLASFVVDHFKEESWARDLSSRPGDLARREVAFFALRLIQTIGLHCTIRWHLKLPGRKRPLSR